MTLPQVSVVAAWHKEALNRTNAEHLEGLSHPDVAVGGACATGRVMRLLGAWVLRLGIRLVPTRVFYEKRAFA